MEKIMYGIYVSGANDLDMLAVICETEQECHDILQNAGGVRKKHVSVAGQMGGTYVDDPTGYYVTTEECSAYKAEDGFIDMSDPDVYTYFLTNYYGGCGGIYSICVQKIEMNKPLVGWDLD